MALPHAVSDQHVDATSYTGVEASARTLQTSGLSSGVLEAPTKSLERQSTSQQYPSSLPTSSTHIGSSVNSAHQDALGSPQNSTPESLRNSELDSKLGNYNAFLDENTQYALQSVSEGIHSPFQSGQVDAPEVYEEESPGTEPPISHRSSPAHSQTAALAILNERISALEAVNKHPQADSMIIEQRNPVKQETIDAINARITHMTQLRANDSDRTLGMQKVSDDTNIRITDLIDLVETRYQQTLQWQTLQDTRTAQNGAHIHHIETELHSLRKSTTALVDAHYELEDRVEALEDRVKALKVSRR